MLLDNKVISNLPNASEKGFTHSIFDLVRLTNSYNDCAVSLQAPSGHTVNAKSVLLILSLQLKKGDTVKVICEGEDAGVVKEAVIAISKFLSLQQ